MTASLLGSISTYSVELLSHLVFHMSICFFFVLVLAEKRISILQYNPSRGHRPIVDTCANEAIPQWGKRRLITFVYLQNMSMVVKQCCGYLPFLSLESCCLEFVWNNHYHELGTERAISLIQVCILWWMSDKVPQGQGFDPEQPLPRGKHDWEKLNVEFTIFNLVIRLSISLLRVLLICRPFKMCMGFWLDGMTQSRLYCLPFPSFVPPPGKLLQVSIHSSVVGLKTC